MKLKKRHKICIDAMQDIESMLRPGIKMRQIWETARKYPARSYTLLGHGIGLDFWEKPIIRPNIPPDVFTDFDMELKPRMVLCIEPTAGGFPDDYSHEVGVVGTTSL